MLSLFDQTQVYLARNPVDMRKQILKTLTVLRKEPVRGKAFVADIDNQVVGYALSISSWSNELGG